MPATQASLDARLSKASITIEASLVQWTVLATEYLRVSGWPGTFRPRSTQPFFESRVRQWWS